MRFVERLPAEGLNSVPREFGLQLSMGQSNNPEALSGVALQGFRETPRHCREGHVRIC